MVIALVASLFTLTVSSPASAVDNRHAVTARIGLSSGSLSYGEVEIYQKDPDPSANYELVTNEFMPGTMDVDLAPGTYKFGFYSEEADAQKFYATGGASGVDLDNASPVVVGAADKDLGVITFAVRSVTVNVKDAHAVAVPGVEVRGAESEADLEDYDNRSASTNGSGTVTFRNLPTTKALYFQGFGSSDDWYQKAEYDNSLVVSLPASTDPGTVNLTMAKRSSIAGKVTGAGAALSMIDVNAYDVVTGHKIGGTVTDSHGNYVVTGLQAGDYRLSFTDELEEYAGEYWNDVPITNLSSTATPITVGANTDVTGKNVDLVANPVVDPVEVDLTGVVRGAGSSVLSNVSVRAYRNGSLKGEFVTGRNGRYSFSNLTSGSYKLEFNRLSGPTDELPYVGQWYLNARSSAGATPVAVTTDTAGADRSMTLPQYGWITGSVTDNANQPVDEAYVSAVNLDGDDVEYGSGAGGFKVLVPPGKYYLRIFGYDYSSDGGSYIPEWYDNVPTMVGAKLVTVTSAGTTSGINAKLATQLETRTAPVISGSPVVGKTLTATTGVWNLMADNEYKITWLRGSTPVGTGASYVVKAADAGSKLAARVDAVHYNLTGQALSAATATVKRPSATKVTATSPKSKTVKLVISVTGTGLANPGGTVTIKRGAATIKSKVAVVNGVAIVKIGKQPKGRQNYKAIYSGTSTVLASTSPNAGVKIKK